MQQKRRAFILLTAVIAAISLAYTRIDAQDTLLDRARRDKTLRIGYAIEAPYAFVKPGGIVTGESPEVARRIASRLGIGRVEWVQTSFDSLITDLNAGRFDVIAAGMFITPERARFVSFSEPTFRVRQALLVKKGNPRGLRSYEDALKRNSVTLAVISGSIEEELLRGMGIPDNQLSVVPDAQTGHVAVESGISDGLAISAPTARAFLENHHEDTLELAHPFEQPNTREARRLGYGAFAFRKNDVELRVAWNGAMRDFLGSDDHIALLREFGLTKEEVPRAVSTAEILSP